MLVARLFRLLVILSGLLAVGIGVWFDRASNQYEMVAPRTDEVLRKYSKEVETCGAATTVIVECKALLYEDVVTPVGDPEVFRAYKELQTNYFDAIHARTEASHSRLMAKSTAFFSAFGALVVWVAFYICRFAFTGTVRPVFPWKLQGGESNGPAAALLDP